MSLEWVACSALTGEVIAEFPDLAVSEVSTLIGAYSTATATLPLVDRDGQPLDADWMRATLPGGVYLVLLDDDLPVWGGIVIRRLRSEGNTLDMSLITPEAYFARRFVGDETFSDDDQCAIVEALVYEYANDSLPIRVEASVSGVTRDRNFAADDDKTLLSVLEELSGVSAGPEWTVGWEAGDSAGRVTYTPVLHVADRLGASPVNGFGTAVTFDFPGAIAEFEYVEDFGEGAGANRVMAVSTAQGDVRPESSPAVFSDVERLVFEQRFTPSTSITSLSVLDGHAQAALARMREGTRTLSVVLDYGTAPKPGVDWRVGDDIGIAIGNGNTRVPAFPHGFETTMRVIGYTYTFDSTPRITPILTEAD